MQYNREWFVIDEWSGGK